MADLSQLLRQYHDIVQQLRQLEDRKNELRELIQAAMKQQGASTSITIGDTVVMASVRTTVKIEYNEAGLRQQLGDRFHSILEPDSRKIRKHLAELRPALEPYLDTIGSVSRDLVADQIEAGALSKEEFEGLYTKEEKNTLYVKMVSPSP